MKEANFGQLKMDGFTIFWIKFKWEEYQIKMKGRRITINTAVFIAAKDALEQKLNGKSTQYIQDIEIGDI